MLKFKKRHISINMSVGLRFLFSVCRPFMFYICIKFRKNIQKDFYNY